MYATPLRKNVNQLKPNNTNLLSVLFWNIEGIKQLNNMCMDDLSEITNHHIIGLYETWNESTYHNPLLNLCKCQKVIRERPSKRRQSITV
jgi:hypothetical protein